VAPAAPAPPRPDCIRHVSELPQSPQWSYPNSDETFALVTPLAAPLGLTHLGAHYERLLPGRRTSWPHAHSEEDELIYVLEGTPDAWIDGHLHRLRPGDVVGWAAGTGIAHTVINNSAGEVKLLVIGEHRRPGDRVFYPVHPERTASLAETRRWSDPPARDRGPHDGLPDARRKRGG